LNHLDQRVHATLYDARTIDCEYDFGKHQSSQTNLFIGGQRAVDFVQNDAVRSVIAHQGLHFHAVQNLLGQHFGRSIIAATPK
jgi:hypothetical protein